MYNHYVGQGYDIASLLCPIPPHVRWNKYVFSHNFLSRTNVRESWKCSIVILITCAQQTSLIKDGWMDERCFRPLLCTVKAELGRGQPGLMRWIWDETLPQSSIDRSTSTLQLTALPSELAAAPSLIKAWEDMHSREQANVLTITFTCSIAYITVSYTPMLTYNCNSN